MSELTDTLNILNIEDWSVEETNVLSYMKTPIQNTIFSRKSDLIGKTLRQSIIYFSETLNAIDRPFCILGNEFRTTRTHTYKTKTSSDENTAENIATLDITVFAPIAFEYVRTRIGITPNDFRSSFLSGELINFVNTGRSGSKMYKTCDDIYIIKTLRDHEAKLLIRTLSGLYLHYSYAASLLTRYVGLYSVNDGSLLSSGIYCVVMLNNLPSFSKVHEVFDLKGSSVGRYSSVTIPTKRLKALKDLDFEIFYPYGLRIPHEIYQRLQYTLESDINELRKLMITDFSLMLGIHHLDEYTLQQQETEERVNIPLKPQLGISALFATIDVNKKAIRSSTDHETIGRSSTTSDEMLMKNFIMKPLSLIDCSDATTFIGNKIATSLLEEQWGCFDLLGIPGITHDGKRVLLYPSFIDCLQTFDSFKRIQSAIQNIRDPKRGSQYSVIHPDDYEKRLLQFLFEKVFIDSQQTLPKLLTSPIVCNSLSLGDIQKRYESQEEELSDLMACESDQISAIDNE